MELGRMSFITFFGIMVPGAYMWGVIMMLAYGIAYQFEISTYFCLSSLTKNPTLPILASFFVSYFLGILLCLTTPNMVDSFICRYCLFTCRNHSDNDKKNRLFKDIRINFKSPQKNCSCENGIWVRFPYKQFLKNKLEENGMEKIYETIEEFKSKISSQNEKPQNKVSQNDKDPYLFFDYCKLFIESKNRALSQHVKYNESFIRFLSGTLVSMFLAFIVSLYYSITFYCYKQYPLTYTYIIVLLISSFGFVVILFQYRRQRQMEIITVWSSVYIIMNNLKLKYNVSMDDLINAYFFPKESASTWSGKPQFYKPMSVHFHLDLSLSNGNNNSVSRRSLNQKGNGSSKGHKRK